MSVLIDITGNWWVSLLVPVSSVPPAPPAEIQTGNLCWIQAENQTKIRTSGEKPSASEKFYISSDAPHTHRHRHTRTQRDRHETHKQRRRQTPGHTHTHSQRSHRCRGHLSNPKGGEVRDLNMLLRNASRSRQLYANTQKQSSTLFTVDCARECLRQILLTCVHSLWWRCAWSSLEQFRLTCMRYSCILKSSAEMDSCHVQRCGRCRRVSLSTKTHKRLSSSLPSSFEHRM